MSPLGQRIPHPHGERHWLSKVTHCPQGHPYSGHNLYIRKCGRRMCRSCNNARRKKAHQRAKSAA